MAVTALDQDEDVNYVALSLDIEKAFDSVSWSFLFNFMRRVGLPEEFTRNVEMLHKDKELRVFNNGHASPPIKVFNGLAQGCSLSPLLLILCMESLARVIRNSPHIEGMPYANKDQRIAMIADDTLLVFKATGRGAREIDAILKAFHNQVGLRINYEKSIACTLGKKDHNYINLFSNPYRWLPRGQSFKYLGLNLGVSGLGQIVGINNFFAVTTRLD